MADRRFRLGYGMQRRWIRLALLWLVAVVYVTGLCLSTASAHAEELPAYTCFVAVDADDGAPPSAQHDLDRCQHQCTSCTILPSAGESFPPVAEVRAISNPRDRIDGLTLAPELLPPIA